MRSAGRISRRLRELGEYTYRLSLCIRHADADLSAIPEKLGLPPDSIWKKGDLSIAPNGRVIGGVRPSSACSIQFGKDYENGLPGGLKAALAILKPHQEFICGLAATGVELSFFIGWFSDFNSRDVLDWATLRDLADLHISLDLDFYAPDQVGQDSK